MSAFNIIRAVSVLGACPLILTGCGSAQDAYPAADAPAVAQPAPELHEASCAGGYRWMKDNEFGQYSIEGRVSGRDWKSEWNRLPEEIRLGNSFLTEVTTEVPICSDRTSDDLIAAAREMCAEADTERIRTDNVYQIEMKQKAIDRAGLGLPIWVTGGPHGSQHRGLDNVVEHFMSRIGGYGSEALFPDGCPPLEPWR
ncbi:hypothetical protein [Nocardia cyriacigeorgica]|uniref:hypothetical protein n=1 Tax=Nocardia cyriacigeorgica TaxID=135487 RepID=UPI002453E699|nr:hypothetical protein [Nocardia cyriacigeorgica]